MDPGSFVDELEAAGVRHVFGVPDSLLKSLIAAIDAAWDADRHVVAANEGAAIGLAIGAYLGTRSPAVVYLQNSGLGNAVNPLVSLAAVYGVPMLLLIGWRGELAVDGSQLHDEPQHEVQGRITLDLLDVLDVPYRVVDAASDARTEIRAGLELASARRAPAALVFRRGCFTPAPPAPPAPVSVEPTRAAIVDTMLATVPPGVPVVATTGLIGRELLRARLALGQDPRRDFLVIGGMGHAVSIAAGLGGTTPGPVVCLDGDGSLAMHTGSLFVAAAVPNLVHVVVNNRVHESVGGQRSAAAQAPLADVARACGYASACRAATLDELARSLRGAVAASGSAFIEVMASVSTGPEPPRPDTPPRRQLEELVEAMTT